MVQQLPLPKKIAYALGQLGWSILSGLISTWLIWYYFPPENVNIPLAIPQGTVLGIFTVIGIITMSGRLFDAFLDPWMATLSDRSKSTRGRRLSFMGRGAVPFALFTVLMFFNPVKGISGWNVAWLTVMLFSFYIFLTMYVTPYFALISEFGHTMEEKIDLCTYISVTFFIGTALATQAPLLWNFFTSIGMSMVNAVRTAFALLSGIALLFMLIPVLTINEKDYADSKPSGLDMLDSFKATFRNKNFLFFTLSDLVYFFALTVFQSGQAYYVTVMLGLDAGWVGNLFVIMGVISFLLYPVVNITAKKIGKKKLLIFAFALFTVIYIYSFFLGRLPFSSSLQAYILAIAASVPLAIFGILPNAIVADISEFDSKSTGIRREAMFFGARTFMQKVGQMLAMLVFSSLLLLGKDSGNDSGIRITCAVAAVTSFLGMVIFIRYRESEVLKDH